VSTNYSSDVFSFDNVTVVDVSNRTRDAHDTHLFDFRFNEGITFPDIIELNFTLTVDPTKQRAIGSGTERSVIVVSPVCRRIPHNGVPALGGGNFEMQEQCGDLVDVGFTSDAPDCFHEIDLSHSCFTASTMLSPNHAPSKAFTDPANGRAWSPAVRSYHDRGSPEYLEVDLGVVTRVHRVITYCTSDPLWELP